MYYICAVLSYTEENYLKALLKIQLDTGNKEVGVNELALVLDLKPATINDMVKKLKQKKLLLFEKYGKISLTSTGKKHGLEVLRKHRLWETFLYEKLDFTWDEVHEVAEQLEHIKSQKLVDKLDAFLNFPTIDPHGDPIPNEKGEIKNLSRKTLNQIEPGNNCKLVAVKDNSAAFLQYVMKVGLGLSSHIAVVSRQTFDNSLEIEVDGNRSNVSEKFAENIFVV